MAFLHFLNPVNNYQKTFNFLRPFGEAAKGIATTARDVGGVFGEDVRAGVGKATGNKEATQAALQRRKKDVRTAIDVAQAAPRGAVQLEQSIRPGASKQDVQATNSLSKKVLGTAPVQSIQTGYKNAKAQGKSTSEALGGATLSFLGDVATVAPVGGAVAGGAVKTAARSAELGTNEIGAIGRNVDGITPAVPRPAPLPRPTPTPEATPVTAGQGSALEELKGRLKSTSELKAEAPKSKLRGKLSTLNEQVFDKQAPVLRLQKQVEKATGSKLPIASRPYDLMRLHAGLPEATKQSIDTLDTSLKTASKAGVDINDLNAYGVAQRIINDRKDIGNTVSPERAQQAVQEITQKYTPEQVRTLQGTYQTFVDHNSELLKGLHDSGLISPEAYKAITENNTSYFAPFQVVDHVVKDLESGGSKYGRGASFNVAKQDIVKAQKGMQEGSELINPVEATIRNTEKVMETVSKNNIGNALGNLSKEAPDIIKPIRTVEDVTARQSLYGEAQHLRPVRNRLQKFVQQQGGYIRQIQTQLNQLNRAGLNESLKTGGKSTPDFTPGGLGGRVSTSRATNKVTPHSAGEEAAMKALGGDELPVSPKLGPQDTSRFVRSLVEDDGSKLKVIRNKIDLREPKLAQAFQELEDLQKAHGEARRGVSDLVNSARSLADKDIPDGYSRISYFKQGIKEDVAIPNELADVFKGLNKSQADLVSGFIGQTNRILKASATSLNIPFLLIKNPIRDIKTAALQTQHGGVAKLGLNWVKGLASALRKDDLYKSWVANKGSGIGLYRDPTNVADKLISKYTDSTAQRIGRVVKSPADLIEAISTPLRKVGGAIEAAPRLAEFKSAVDRGVNPQEAALDARNVTVDFAKSGSVGQIANQWVPFLNARLQGTERLYNAFKTNPKRALAVYTGTTALPIIATYAYNYTEHKDVMDQLPQDLKDNNFIIIKSNAQDKNGNFTDIIKIPKSQIDQVFGNPVEEFAKFLSDNDPKSLKQVLLEATSNVSPQDFVQDGKASLSRSLSGAPAALRVPFETFANKNAYFGNKIVPDRLSGLPNNEQYLSTSAPITSPQYSATQDTSPIASLLGKVTGQSPLKAENAIRGFTSSLTTANPIAGVKNSLTGSKGNQASNSFYQVLDKASKDRASASSKINNAIADGDLDKAQTIASDYNKALAKQFTPWAKKYGQYATEDLATAFDGLPINLNRTSIAQRRYNLKKKVEARQ